MNGKRPPDLKPPANLSPSPPVPEPREFVPDPQERAHGPTRYGDWESKGMAVDF